MRVEGFEILRIMECIERNFRNFFTYLRGVERSIVLEEARVVALPALKSFMIFSNI